MPRYRLSAHYIRKSLDAVAEADRDVRRAIQVVGYPEPRRRPEGFETLLRAIVGQQISVSAAAAIYGRVETAMKSEMSAEKLLRLREASLRKAGLSGPKVRYVRSLARAVRSGELDLKNLGALSDELAMKEIQTVPGLGLWSAQIYLMVSLGRPDIWPQADVGAMRGLQRLKGIPERLTAKEAADLVEPMAPHRSAIALLAWRCANAPAL